VRFAASGPVAIGVAVDVDSLSVCAVGLDGAVRAHRQQARDHRRLQPTAVFDGAAALTADVEADVGARVLGVGLALPALLSAVRDAGSPEVDTPVVLRAPNLPRLVGCKPGAALAERLGRPVMVDNEATLGAVAHLDLAPDLVYVSTGIGIGGGIVLDGRVYRGARQYDRAVEQSRKTLELDPNFPHAHWTLGLAYLGRTM
jgi:predicted NBD/HSP70 family sugar kinase